jgi:hypothetical protein
VGVEVPTGGGQGTLQVLGFGVGRHPGERGDAGKGNVFVKVHDVSGREDLPGSIIRFY